MIRRLLIGIIRFYQRYISIMTPPSCRYSPTCSHYGIEAISVHGPVKGSWLTTRRVLSCHPFSAGGYDPVPPKEG